jgi:hypothetical protein
MPEFYLNSSSTQVSYTSGCAECTGFYAGILDTTQWIMYGRSQFGCGKYMLDYHIINDKTVLRASPFWMGIDPIDGSVQDLDIKQSLLKLFQTWLMNTKHLWLEN